MKTNRGSKRPAAPWLALVGLLAAACAPADAGVRAGESGELQVLPRAEGAEYTAFFWQHAGEQSAASIWFGPWMLDEAGMETRFWTLTITHPGTEYPMVNQQGKAHRDRADRIWFRGSWFHLEVKPSGDLTWGDVRSPNELAVDLEGFF